MLLRVWGVNRGEAVVVVVVDEDWMKAMEVMDEGESYLDVESQNSRFYAMDYAYCGKIVD